jgi:hypothetical protein
MEDQMVIVVLDVALDHKGNISRKWPARLEDKSIKRKSSENCLTSDENVLLYAFHVTDFDSFPVTKKGVFCKNKKLWPKNVLWYSGGGIDGIKIEYPNFIKFLVK